MPVVLFSVSREGHASSEKCHVVDIGENNAQTYSKSKMVIFNWQGMCFRFILDRQPQTLTNDTIRNMNLNNEYIMEETHKKDHCF